MSNLDERDRQRLARLRARDVTGVYADDSPAAGTDPDGAVTLTLDPTLRILRAEVGRIDLVRTEDALNSALTSAYAVALSGRAAHADPADTPHGEPPQPRRLRLEVRRPTPEMLARHQVRERANARPRPRFPREERGTSANGCLAVTLPVASPRGPVEVDHGWLQLANSAQLGAALTEAYNDAYSRRDS
jgi:hypothetical protein